MASHALSPEELSRYNRHIIIPGFGTAGQQKLKDARVLVVGCGGLGAPLLSYLVAAGVGTLGLMDDDLVDPSNLHRQVLFSLEDVGKPKVDAAAHRLHQQNPYVKLVSYQEKLTSKNALEIIGQYDIVADGTDNFPTRYLVNDACVLLGKTNVYASIYRFEGQLSVFNYIDQKGNSGPNYRDLYPSPPPPGQVPSCAEGGVLGVLPGIMGSLQANEVIKLITGIGEPLAGQLYVFDTLSFESRKLKFGKREDNPLRGNPPMLDALIDYEAFCGIGSQQEDENHLEHITPLHLKEIQQRGDAHYLLDVRQPYEYDIANLGGHLIPLDQLSANFHKIPQDQTIIVHCRSGQRSQQAIAMLKEEGFQKLFNLKGGILAWAATVDHNMPTY